MGIVIIIIFLNNYLFWAAFSDDIKGGLVPLPIAFIPSCIFLIIYYIIQ